MARLQFYCALCGMPAVTLLKGTAVCNNAQCQEAAGLSDMNLAALSPSPPAPLENKYHTAPGFAKRVAGPNESAVRRGTLVRGPSGLELQDTEAPYGKLHICTPDEIGDVLDFISDNFPEEWSREMNKPE